MGYRIAYDPSRKEKFYTTKSKRVPRWLIMAILTAGAIAVFGDHIAELLLPGDPQVTSAALSTLVEDLRAGDTFSDAITAFCTHIVENAQ